MLFPNVCYSFSDLLLKWSKKDGFSKISNTYKENLQVDFIYASLVPGVDKNRSFSIGNRLVINGF